VFSRDGGVGQNGFEGVGRDRLDRQGVRRGFAEHGEKAIRKIPSGDRRGARNEVATEADESQKDGERQRADGCGGRDTDPDRERNRDDDVDRRTRKTPVFTGVRGLLESREDVGKIDHRSPLSLGTRRTVKNCCRHRVGDRARWRYRFAVPIVCDGRRSLSGRRPLQAVIDTVPDSARSTGWSPPATRVERTETGSVRNFIYYSLTLI